MSTGPTLADAIAALVAEKRAVGYTYAAEERVLARFAAFCRSEFPGLAAPTHSPMPSVCRRRPSSPWRTVSRRPRGVRRW